MPDLRHVQKAIDPLDVHEQTVGLDRGDNTLSELARVGPYQMRHIFHCLLVRRLRHLALPVRQKTHVDTPQALIDLGVEASKQDVGIISGIEWSKIA